MPVELVARFEMVVVPEGSGVTTVTVKVLVTVAFAPTATVAVHAVPATVPTEQPVQASPVPE